MTLTYGEVARSEARWVWIMAIVAALMFAWLAFGVGVVLGARSTTSSLAGALALNEHTREATLQRWMDSTCVLRLTPPLQGRIK